MSTTNHTLHCRLYCTTYCRLRLAHNCTDESIHSTVDYTHCSNSERIIHSDFRFVHYVIIIRNRQLKPMNPNPSDMRISLVRSIRLGGVNISSACFLPAHQLSWSARPSRASRPAPSPSVPHTVCMVYSTARATRNPSRSICCWCFPYNYCLRACVVSNLGLFANSVLTAAHHLSSAMPRILDL